MLRDLKTTLARCQPTLWQDALGAASLMVLLLAGLHLPALI